jgi:glycine/D-amino acid oxidase-like deaminating enzyme
MVGEGGAGKSSMVVIIGGGIMGLSVAEACLLSGREAMVFEREERGWCGASSGGSGLVLPVGRERWALAARGLSAAGKWARLRRARARRGLGEAVLAGVRELEAEGLSSYRAWCGAGGAGEIGLREACAVVVSGGGGGIEAEKALASREGVEGEELGKGELRALGLATGAGGVRYREAWQLDPGGLLNWLGRRVSALGGHIEYGAWVKRVRCRGRRVRGIETADGREFEVDDLVVAAGAWSGRVLGGMGVRLPLGIGKGYGASWDFSGGGLASGMAVVLADVGLELVSAGGLLRVVSRPEWGRLGKGSGGDDRRRSERLGGAVERCLAAELAVAGEPRASWRRMEGHSPDGLPYVGRVRPLDNVSVAAGHGGRGISLAPATGRLVAKALGAKVGEGARGQGAIFEPRRFG